MKGLTDTIQNGTITGRWQRLIPALIWLRKYRASWFKGDLIAGITLASFVLPSSMAYAGLAGLPAQVGIYACLVGGLVFAFFTTSRQLVIGPTSSISLLVGTTLGVISGGDPIRWLALASLTAFGVGIISVVAYIIRLSQLVNFISETILLGFKTGAALSILSTILPDLLGIKGDGHNFFERLHLVISQLSIAQWPVIIFGAIAFILLLLGEKCLPGRPTSLLIVILSILVMSIFSLSDLGLATIGIIRKGLPSIALPPLHLNDLNMVFDLSFACFIIGYIETISVGRLLAADHNYEIDNRQELFSMGMANIGTSLTGGYPISGGLSQSAVNDKAGAKTPMALIICSIILAVILLFFNGLFNFLPRVMLSAIVLHSVLSLFKYRDLRKIYLLDRQEFMVAMVALSGVVVFGILKGVIIASLLSILMVIQRASKPNIARLGRIGNSDRYSDIRRHPDNILIPGVVVLRVEASLFYFNAQYVRDEILAIIDKEGTPPGILVLDLSSAPWVDVAGAKMLLELTHKMNIRGIEFHIVDALAVVRDILRKIGLEKKLGHISRRDSIHEAVETFRQRNLPGAIS